MKLVPFHPLFSELLSRITELDVRLSDREYEVEDQCEGYESYSRDHYQLGAELHTRRIFFEES